MNIGSNFGPPQISNTRLDFNSKNLDSLEKSTLHSVASLQGESFSDTVTQYQLTKHVGETKGIAFVDGKTVVENIGDFIKSLANRADQFGGKDDSGVTSNEYRQVGIAKGLIVNERI